jgi:hypothetical protein
MQTPVGEMSSFGRHPGSEPSTVHPPPVPSLGEKPRRLRVLLLVAITREGAYPRLPSWRLKLPIGQTVFIQRKGEPLLVMDDRHPAPLPVSLHPSFYTRGNADPCWRDVGFWIAPRQCILHRSSPPSRVSESSTPFPRCQPRNGYEKGAYPYLPLWRSKLTYLSDHSVYYPEEWRTSVCDEWLRGPGPSAIQHTYPFPRLRVFIQEKADTCLAMCDGSDRLGSRSVYPPPPSRVPASEFYS